MPHMLNRSKFLLTLTLAALTGCATGTPAASTADPMVYVVNYSQEFGTLDLATGAFVQIGQPLPEGSQGLVPGPGGSLLTLTFSGNLEAITPATGGAKVIGPTGLGGNANNLAELGSTVYATDLSNNLYTVNTTTGLATLIGATGMPADEAFTPPSNSDGSINLFDETLFAVGGELYATFDEWSLGANGYSIDPSPSDPYISPVLYQINPQTGVATVISSTTWRLTASVVVDGIVYSCQGTPSAAHPLPTPYLSVDTLNLTDGITTVISPFSAPALADGPIGGAWPVP